MRRRRWPFALLALAIAAACIRLGVWQLHRLGERRARNVEIAAAREQPPVVLGGTPVAIDSVAQRRVRAAGRFDYDHEFVWRGRSFQDVPGVDIITPLRLADGSAVYVDRGWVPSPDAVHIDLRAFREEDSVVVSGLGYAAPRGRGDVDPRGNPEALPYPVRPFLLQQLPPPEVVEPTPGAYLRRWSPPPLDNGPHLSYALQWFSFALIILVGTGVLLRAEGRRE